MRLAVQLCVKVRLMGLSSSQQGSTWDIMNKKPMGKSPLMTENVPSSSTVLRTCHRLLHSVSRACSSIHDRGDHTVPASCCTCADHSGCVPGWTSSSTQTVCSSVSTPFSASRRYRQARSATAHFSENPQRLLRPNVHTSSDPEPEPIMPAVVAASASQTAAGQVPGK